RAPRRPVHAGASGARIALGAAPTQSLYAKPPARKAGVLLQENEFVSVHTSMKVEQTIFISHGSMLAGGFAFKRPVTASRQAGRYAVRFPARDQVVGAL